MQGMNAPTESYLRVTSTRASIDECNSIQARRSSTRGEAARVGGFGGRHSQACTCTESSGLQFCAVTLCGCPNTRARVWIWMSDGPFRFACLFFPPLSLLLLPPLRSFLRWRKRWRNQRRGATLPRLWTSICGVCALMTRSTVIYQIGMKASARRHRRTAISQIGTRASARRHRRWAGRRRQLAREIAWMTCAVDGAPMRGWFSFFSFLFPH